MINKSFDTITKEDVEFILSNQTPESKTMEYKLLLPENGDEAKKEFLADISSFANASGGDILYGISEKDGIPDEIPGLEDINPDKETLRIGNMIRDSIEPRIPGVMIRGIDGFTKGPVLLIRIPNSWVSPHMVTYKTSPRFFSRSSAGKFPMDVTEIRTAFTETEELPTKIERFIDGRLGKIIAGETPVPLTDNPKIILHVLPFSSFGRGLQNTVTEQREKSILLHQFYAGGYNTNVNVDGLITSDSAKTSYCQMFRSGRIESVDTGVLEISGDKKTIPSTYIVQSLLKATSNYLKALKELNVPEPVVVKLSIIGAKGYKLAIGRDASFPASPKVIDRDVLHLPESVIYNYDSDIRETIRPILDGLWNASGHDSCTLYDSKGKFTKQ